MNTPISNFVRNYKAENKLRLHMPGHKGRGELGIEALDITEIDGADVLYGTDDKSGIISESQANVAKIFGTAKTLYSTEGSSLAIRAMLYLAKLYGKNNYILAGRNAHKTVMTASALLNLNVEWYREQTGPNDTISYDLMSCNITPDGLEYALSNRAYKPCAVYVTSPDYLGNILDIAGLAEVCHAHDTILIVDNAHGAYLEFLQTSMHPIALGADLCCDSAHKTLPVLTGGAYLHISKNAPQMFVEQAERAMALFASTSPSYLILQSLDLVNRYLSEGYSERLQKFVDSVVILKTRLRDAGFVLCGNEPLKLTLATKSYGYTGIDFARLLSRSGIECEFSDPDYVVMMLTPEIGIEALNDIFRAITSIEKQTPLFSAPPRLPIPRRACTIHEAIFAPSRICPLHQARGKTLAAPSVSCPPAVPILMCGEVIDDAAIRCFEYYGITEVRIRSNTF